MPSNKPKFLIIGSGWYGCHAASFLMEKGFNLILIERDGDSLQALEEQLRKLLPERNPIIIRIVLNKFDKDSINWAVCKYSTYPVKIFVNCKTSKKAPA
jgi:short-subunit dehydrogenase